MGLPRGQEAHYGTAGTRSRSSESAGPAKASAALEGGTMKKPRTGAAIEPLSHDNFDIAITLTGADRCALSKSVCVTGLGLAD